jgi:hypothetical protein
MSRLSILIPARQEMFLKNTVEDILAHIEGDTNIIVGLDGAWADPPIQDHPKVFIIHHTTSIGQRTITNECARLSTAKYLMKVDAHCSFDQGFDVKMMADMQDDWTMVPLMRNLHAFDWICPDGHRRYQGPSGSCTVCGKETTRDMKWIAKENPKSTAYRFDKDMHFQYWQELKKRQEGDLVETMSLQGSCFMVTRDKYFNLDLCSEEFSSWGQQGVEVACKTWLSGGRVIVNKKTWYAHMFRTQGGDFSFPYPNPGKDVVNNRKKSRELFTQDKWPKAIHKFQWLIDKFQPPEWEVSPPTGPTKAMLFYTSHTCPMKIAHKVQHNLLKISQDKNIPLYSSSLKPMPHMGVKNIFQPLARSEYKLVDDKLVETQVPRTQPGVLTMFRQILDGLKICKADIIFFCEHDILYHPSHFDFVPPTKDKFYYNTNVWKVRWSDGFAVKVDVCQQTSGLCAYRDLLIEEYQRRVDKVEKEGWQNNMGYEPGTKLLIHNGFSDLRAESWQSEKPNIDIRHDNNMTPSRWKPEEFIHPKNVVGWTESTLEKIWQI